MQNANQNWGCFFATLTFGLLSTLVGVGSMYYVIVAPLMSMRDAGDWVETPCVIRESSVERHTHNRAGERHEGFYSIAVNYDYRYEGREYTSDRYDFYEVSTGEDEWKKEVVAEIPPGTETVCFVNPNDSSEAVLSRAQNVGYVTAIPGVLFLLVGLFGLYAAFFGGLIPWRGRQLINDEPGAQKENREGVKK